VFLVAIAFSRLHWFGPDVGWLDGDPGAIWNRPPGFYKDGNDWYAIVHCQASGDPRQISGRFHPRGTKCGRPDQDPDGKFWWFKARIKASLDLLLPDNTNLSSIRAVDLMRETGSAARRWKNSGLAAVPFVTCQYRLSLETTAAGHHPSGIPQYLPLQSARFTDRIPGPEQ